LISSGLVERFELLSSEIVKRGKPTVFRLAANTLSDCLLTSLRRAKTWRAKTLLILELLSSGIVERGKPTVVRGAANTCFDAALGILLRVFFLVFLLPYRNLSEFPLEFILGNLSEFLLEFILVILLEFLEFLGFLGRDAVLPITNICMRF
jgi:hypothetical protein